MLIEKVGLNRQYNKLLFFYYFKNKQYFNTFTTYKIIIHLLIFYKIILKIVTK